MRLSLKVFCLCVATFLLASCRKDAATDGHREVTLRLSIGVGNGVAASRSNTLLPPQQMMQSSQEMMQSLRVVVVDQSGRVEHNRLLQFQQAPTVHYADADFKVVGGERKQILLVANEESQFADGRRAIAFDMGQFEVGSTFQRQQLDEELIYLTDASQQMALPLPMSAIYEIDLPATGECNVDLEIVRAAVKFLVRVTNDTPSTIELDQIRIDKMARKEYLLPRNATYSSQPSEEDPATDLFTIVGYDVPTVGSNDYYSYEQPLAVTLTTGASVWLDPIYLCEGRYDSPTSDERNYSMMLRSADGLQRSGLFDNLPQLPRNTCVVVDAVINSTNEVTLDVRVYPYGEYLLKPEFGW